MRTRKLYKCKIVIIFAVIIIIAICLTILTKFNDHTYIATVIDKYEVAENEDDNLEPYYFIVCKGENGNDYEFKIKNIYIRKNFKSFQLYNQLEVGEKYEFTVVGFPVNLFSVYETIIKFEEIN